LIGYKDDNNVLVDQFSVSFHKVTADGIDPEGSLLINSVPSDHRGADLTGERIDINIDRSNLVEFRKSILTIVKLMVKYNAFIVVNEGPGITSRNVLYLSLRKFLTEEYVKTSYTGNSISGTLTNSGNSLYSTGHLLYDGEIWNSDNIFPIYAFIDGKNIDSWILAYFNQLSISYNTPDQRYSDINEYIAFKTP